MNLIGVVAALTAFLAVWVGHVAVRKIERAAPNLWIPLALFMLIGLLFEWFALRALSAMASTALGIVGITFLWDALELLRQQKRVRIGHAPANPRNPRHAAILSQPRSRATEMDLLKLEPAAIQRQNGTRSSVDDGRTLH